MQLSGSQGEFSNQTLSMLQQEKNYLINELNQAKKTKSSSKFKALLKLQQSLNTGSSKYRGVSKNGNQWQAIIMVNNKKRYVGSYSQEVQAARAYDIAAIQNHGDKVKCLELTVFFDHQSFSLLVRRKLILRTVWTRSKQ
jgi:hypothetical protein